MFGAIVPRQFPPSIQFELSRCSCRQHPIVLSVLSCFSATRASYGIRKHQHSIHRQQVVTGTAATSRQHSQTA